MTAAKVNHQTLQIKRQDLFLFKKKRKNNNIICSIFPNHKMSYMLGKVHLQ